MGIGIATPPSHLTLSNKFTDYLLTINSMSQRFQQGNFSYSNGFNNRSEMMHQDQHHHHALTTIEGVDSGGGDSSSVYESGGMTMLSEMFNFQAAAGGAATVAAPSDILDTHMAETYRLQRPSDWYGNRMVGSLGTLGETKQHQHSLSSINVDSAATAMQLFLLNPQPRSPSPTSTTPTSSTPLHLLHPDRSTPPDYHPDAAFPGNPIPQTQFTWISGSGGGENTQRLSLSLSSLQHLEAVKAEEIRIGDAGLMYYNQGPSSSSSSYQMKHLGSQYPQGMGQNQNHEQQIHGGYSSSSFSVINLLRNSKYAKAAQELLEEICSVGRGHMKNSMRFGKNIKNPNKGNNQSAGGESSSSLSKEAPPLSAADKIEYQRKKATLLSMLDEVHRRYSHYCEQMQMVVNSFDSVMGYGAATPYTVLAQKAMSRHFRCLKDAILGQLKIIREVTGEKDGGSSGITKGETPRLKLLDQSLRQQRAFQQMGIMDQEAWRPQRGLPERSVTVLRAWLFEHFLHPYPSDADKHLLARQTGLSRNQVSNWFINARVRLWKPMVEEMYQQESKEQEEDEGDMIERDKTNGNAQTPTPSPTSPTIAGTGGRRSEIDAYENDASLNAINRQCFSENQATATTNRYNDVSPIMLYNQVAVDHRPGAIVVDYGTTGADAVDIDSKLVRFGTTTGDVSLTLGLQHTGNLPENNQFSDGDFGSC